MNQILSRREMLKTSAALSALAFLPLSAFGLPSTDEDATPIHFLDAQPEGKMLKWENMDSWITPNEQVFAVSHYGPANVDPATYELEISGLVGKPRTLTLEQLKKRRKKDVIATLECSGNSSSPTFAGA